MPLPPLTHHDILALVEPFTRRGRHLDLAASDRVARQLAFRPVEHRDVPAGDGHGTLLPHVIETLSLEQAQADRFVLRRELATPEGLRASLRAEGGDPGDLLAAVESVPVGRQFLGAAGTVAALEHRLPPAARPDGTSSLQLRGAEARLGGVTLRMQVSAVRGYPAEFELLRQEGGARTLPDDLFEVLGRRWGRLVAGPRSWRGSVDLRGAEPQRSEQAEAQLVRAIEHLARTLAEAPARFHERHYGARWAVSLRRSVPLTVGLAFVAVAVVVQRWGPGHESKLAMLANLGPPLLMALFFLRREMPRIELPRVPRRSAAGDWPVATPPD